MKKVNEVSALAGVSKRTLQYYDDKGLICVDRTENNYRLFDDEDLKRVWEILVYREMKLELNEIHQMMLMNEEEKNIFLNQKKEEIEGEISLLKDELDFIAAVQLMGIPEMQNSDRTYVEQIEVIKRSMLEAYRNKK
ncbi:MAG: MerR family transcriptional regulator [Erysipelotrichaceae bacterium]|nr:MerR family transcriptional regulator [Erysipelotrichaceae bacterium]